MTRDDIPVEMRGWVDETGKPPKGGPYIVTVAWAHPVDRMPNYWVLGYSYRLQGGTQEWRMVSGAHVEVLKRRRQDERNGTVLLATFEADGVEHSRDRVMPKR